MIGKVLASVRLYLDLLADPRRRGSVIDSTASIALTLLCVLASFMVPMGMLFDGSEAARIALLTTVAQILGIMAGLTLSVLLVAGQLSAQHFTIHATRMIFHEWWIRIWIFVNATTLMLCILMISRGDYITVDSAALARADESLVVIMGLASVITLIPCVFHGFEVLTPVGLAKRLSYDLDVYRRIQEPDNEPLHSDPIDALADLTAALVERRQFRTLNKVLDLVVQRTGPVMNQIPLIWWDRRSHRCVRLLQRVSWLFEVTLRRCADTGGQEIKFPFDNLLQQVRGLPWDRRVVPMEETAEGMKPCELDALEPWSFSDNVVDLLHCALIDACSELPHYFNQRVASFLADCAAEVRTQQRLDQIYHVAAKRQISGSVSEYFMKRYWQGGELQPWHRDFLRRLDVAPPASKPFKRKKHRSRSS